jgi:hypothetical protein
MVASNRKPQALDTLLPPASTVAADWNTPLDEQFPASTATIPAPPPSSRGEEGPMSVIRTMRSPPPPAIAYGGEEEEPATEKQPQTTLPPPPASR